MPYNGLRAKRGRERLAQALMQKDFNPSLPVDNPRVTSPWGMRTHPILNTKKFHHGVDYGVPEGSPIYASDDGYISAAGSSDPVHGTSVTVKHPSRKGTYETRYHHMKKMAKPALKGGWVKKGDIIGYSGNTGRSTGPHLHYGMWLGPKSVDPGSFESIRGLSDADVARMTKRKRT